MTKEQADIVRAALSSYYAAYGKRRGQTEGDRQRQREISEAREAFERLLVVADALRALAERIDDKADEDRWKRIVQDEPA